MTEDKQIRSKIANQKRKDELEAEKERLNPCLKESKMAMKCLDDNGYDRKQCQDYFDNYKYCRKFWGWVQNHRKRQGIYPLLPPPEEREQVKQEYLHMNKNL